MALAYIGLGSNLADPCAQILTAFRALKHLPQTRVLRCSRLYRSAPWGKADQPEFVNAVAELETALTPHALLDALLGIERKAGRVRNGDHWGPRVLDLDILVFAGTCIDDAGLRIPHPRLHERAFALMPLAEIAPNLAIPGRDNVANLLAQIDTSDCRALESNASATE